MDDDVTPIIISEDLLVHLPFNEVREITLHGLSNVGEPWNAKIKVQTVGVINPGSAIISMKSGTSGLNGYTISSITDFVRDKGRIIISAMPKKYENDIIMQGRIMDHTLLVQVEDGYDPSEIANELMLLDGLIGATPLDTLIDKMRDNYSKDIASYIVDLTITFGISLVSICGFNILSQRRQREQLSIYYMCGFSWLGCIVFDVLKTVFVVAIPGAVALLVEKIRLLIGMNTIISEKIVKFLVNALNFDELKVRNFMIDYGIKTGSSFAYHDVGYFVDKYTFIYSFLLIVCMYILSSVWFHISMMKTRPADEIRKWQ